MPVGFFLVEPPGLPPFALTTENVAFVGNRSSPAFYHIRESLLQRFLPVVGRAHFLDGVLRRFSENSPVWELAHAKTRACPASSGASVVSLAPFLPHARRDGGPLLRSLLQDNADGPKKTRSAKGTAGLNEKVVEPVYMPRL